MGKFDGILICTDLDGTLFRNDKTVSHENREAIEYFKREGGYFTFITGRMPCYSTTAYRAAAPNVPFGCANGGAVYDGAANKYIWKQEIDPSVLELVEYIDERFSDIGIQIYMFDKVYFARENDLMVKFRGLTGLPALFCDYHSVSEPMAKVIFGSESEETLLDIAKALREHPLAENFDFIRSEKTLFEVLPKGVTKGLALEKLVDYLKIDPRRTVAIGDYDNDIGMFKSAGLSIAVSNACEAALAAADRVTVSNEESAIARVIADIENGEYLI